MVRTRFRDGVLLVAGMAILAGCHAKERTACSEEALLDRRDAYIQDIAEQNFEDGTILLDRIARKQDDYAAGKSTEPPAIDILVVSGGGDYGAFAAGFLLGWGDVTQRNHVRPQFDIVTGVSTGALIAPFAFLGDDEAYRRVFKLYQEPKDDWVLLRGIFFFLPHNESLASIDGLRRDVAREVDTKVLERLVEGRKEGRLCEVSATNLDFGMRRVWDLGREAEIALAPGGSAARVHDRLLASAAVPAAFPPVVIDGNLYVDGCVTSNILYNANMRSPTSFVHRWKERFPGRALPPIRVWVIINNQLQQIPRITEQTWLGITAASTEAIVRSATVTALELLATELQLLQLIEGVRTEFHFAAIPDYWRAPKPGVFQKETMESLAKLGEEMGADPNSWRDGTTLPAQVMPWGRGAAPAEVPGQPGQPGKHTGGVTPVRVQPGS